ncbi:MAG: CotH kinase family protein [Planctomycetes bacterium]|nr:CotH kinase family protein [Planctomycetota bacterium]
MKRVLWMLFVLYGCNHDDGGDDGGGGTPAPTPPPEEANVFDENEFTDYRLTMAPGDWAAILNDNDGFRSATLTWKGTTLEQIGVRPSGENRFSGKAKPSLRLRFDAFVPDQRFHGLRELELDGLWEDWSMMRDRLSYGIYASRIHAPRAVHARLLVNDEYRGVYQAEEVVDDIMIVRRTVAPPTKLYHVWLMSGDQYVWLGPDHAMYVPFPFEPLTDEGGNHSRLVAMVDALNNAPDTLGTHLDLAVLINFVAAETAVTNTDGLTGDFGPYHHYLYHQDANGPFRIVPWDLNATWWAVSAERDIFHNFQQSGLTKRIQDDPHLRAEYLERLSELADGAASAQAVAARVDFIYEQIAAAAHEDPFKPYSNQNFDDSRVFIKNFAVQREASIRAQVAQHQGGTP